MRTDLQLEYSQTLGLVDTAKVRHYRSVQTLDGFGNFTGEGKIIMSKTLSAGCIRLALRGSEGSEAPRTIGCYVGQVGHAVPRLSRLLRDLLGQNSRMTSSFTLNRAVPWDIVETYLVNGIWDHSGA